MSAGTSQRVPVVWPARGRARLGLPAVFRAAALSGLLALSAWASAICATQPRAAWVGCVALFPLFWSIRALRVWPAFTCGALWGAVRYATGAVVSDPPVAHFSVFGLLCFAACCGTYAALGCGLTRRLGFRPLLLGLGWIALELAVRPFGLRTGLIVDVLPDDAPLLFQWVGRLLGYGFVAFIIVIANASLLAVVSHARLGLPTLQRPFAGRLFPSSRTFAPQTSPSAQLLALLSQAHPRAPPV